MDNSIKVNVEVSDALANKFGNLGGTRVGGVFQVTHTRNGEVLSVETSPNIVVDEGLEYILDSALSGGAQSTNYYIGLFSNNYTPVAGDTMAGFPTAAGEVTAEVDEATRQAWSEAGVASKVLTNTASPAVFTANASIGAYGAFLSSTNTKGSTSGKLIAASKFSSVRNLLNTDTLNVTYTLTIADA